MSNVGWVILENIVTVSAITAIILGVYAMGGGGYGFWALVLLLNINTRIPSKS